MTDLEDLNHYERLGVLEDASPEEIKAAHRARIKEFHPDHRPIAYRTTFDQMMKEINAAHDVLKDPRKRAAYNRKLAGERLDAAGPAPRSSRGRGTSGVSGMRRPGAHARRSRSAAERRPSGRGPRKNAGGKAGGEKRSTTGGSKEMAGIRSGQQQPTCLLPALEKRSRPSSSGPRL